MKDCTRKNFSFLNLTALLGRFRPPVIALQSFIIIWGKEVLVAAAPAVWLVPLKSYHSPFACICCQQGEILWQLSTGHFSMFHSNQHYKYMTATPGHNVFQLHPEQAWLGRVCHHLKDNWGLIGWLRLLWGQPPSWAPTGCPVSKCSQGRGW